MEHLLLQFGAAGSGSCSYPASSFLGLPHWYQYLPGVSLITDSGSVVCNPQLTNINDVWLILAAIIEILVRLAAVAAVAYVIYGGVKYMTSQGEPDKTAQARHTIVNALSGLVLAVLSAVLVAFVAGSIK